MTTENDTTITLLDLRDQLPRHLEPEEQYALAVFRSWRSVVSFLSVRVFIWLFKPYLLVITCFYRFLGTLLDLFVDGRDCKH